MFSFFKKFILAVLGLCCRALASLAAVCGLSVPTPGINPWPPALQELES